MQTIVCPRLAARLSERRTPIPLRVAGHVARIEGAIPPSEMQALVDWVAADGALAGLQSDRVDTRDPEMLSMDDATVHFTLRRGSGPHHVQVYSLPPRSSDPGMAHPIEVASRLEALRARVIAQAAR